MPNWLLCKATRMLFHRLLTSWISGLRDFLNTLFANLSTIICRIVLELVRINTRIRSYVHVNCYIHKHKLPYGGNKRVCDVIYYKTTAYHIYDRKRKNALRGSRKMLLCCHRYVCYFFPGVSMTTVIPYFMRDSRNCRGFLQINPLKTGERELTYTNRSLHTMSLWHNNLTTTHRRKNQKPWCSCIVTLINDL